MLGLIHKFETKKIKDCSIYLIRATQDPSLPSCEALLIKYVNENLLRSPSLSKSQDTVRAAETLVYNIALDLLDSSVYRYPTGILTPTGEQLLHICQCCLDRFSDKGYITQAEFCFNRDYLKHCSHDFEKYGSI